jgi:hypothetical protein
VEALGERNPNEWKAFIDFLKLTLKTVLFPDGNK